LPLAEKIADLSGIAIFDFGMTMAGGSLAENAEKLHASTE
jgi:hypothetical protein